MAPAVLMLPLIDAHQSFGQNRIVYGWLKAGFGLGSGANF
jgi:hypothetical protein